MRKQQQCGNSKFEINMIIKECVFFHLVCVCIVMARTKQPPRLAKHFTLLKLLSKAKPRQCRSIVSCANKDQIGCLCECVLNVLSGNVPIDNARRLKLRKYKGKFRKILDKRTNLSKKRKLLEQSGGFLPMLLAPIIGLAGSLIGDAISGAINKR